MAAASHQFVTRVRNPRTNQRPTNGEVVQTGRYDNGGPDVVLVGGTRNEARAYGGAGENIYDQINLSTALDESGQNQYAPLTPYQNGVDNIYTKLDSLEQNQRHLAEQFQDSQKRILSELSQVKDMVNILSDLVKKSLTTAQKISAEQEQRVQELAANLGQEVFHIGQEVMSTIRERNDEDMAKQTWRQEMETDRMSRLSSDSNNKSKRKTLYDL